MDLDGLLEEEEIVEVRPLLQSYSLFSKCKSLGLTMSADQFTYEQIDQFYAIQEAVRVIHEKQAKHG